MTEDDDYEENLFGDDEDVDMREDTADGSDATEPLGFGEDEEGRMNDFDDDADETVGDY